MTSIRILHLANDYAGSAVYKHLIAELDKLGITQTVYCPIRHASLMDKNKITFNSPDSRIIYSPILNTTTDRLFYPLKIKKLLRDIEQQIDLSKIDFIHAHTWYSDGGVAYLLSKKYDIPYIVAVRNTDMNLFQKWMFFLRPFGSRILSRAKNIILIAAAYKSRLLSQRSLRGSRRELEEKIRTIPNGVDDYWLEHAVVKRKPRTGDTFNLLFIGKFNAGKNILALQEAVKLLTKEYGGKIKLHIVGGGGNKTKEVIANVKNYPDLFQYHGKIFDKERLLSIFSRCDVFAMPSKHETFGLVYVEAMLQGLPIMYRKNEGIDGFYDDKIGEAVTDGDAEEIKEKIKLLFDRYESYQINIPLIAKNHNWEWISLRYKNIYFE